MLASFRFALMELIDCSQATLTVIILKSLPSMRVLEMAQISTLDSNFKLVEIDGYA